ncbi:alpha-galactosidase [Umezawaea endophytica]|uniref:alpha-galactosidase n=1 Tax=Umezawaea endophytica TaxID=1654476 RepID=A0A9X3A5Q0_9PSEU|nr:alpha-galactosidase [Umezawaea endophytica]MCS7483959.1 alpha-galactosidase [Umezawaea endophytica]
MATTTYTVGLPEHEGWLEQIAWGPTGVEHGPSPTANAGRTPYMTAADGAPVEYAPFGLRPFTGADLVLDQELFWRFDGEDSTPTSLRLAFVDDLTGLRTVLCYRTSPSTDVLLRWVELTNGGTGDLVVDQLGSAGFCLPVESPELTFLTGRWAHEFQREQLVLPAGRFEIGSSQGVPGHQFASWLAVRDAVDGQAWAVSLAWSGSWRIAVDVEVTGATRVRAGRAVSGISLAPGETLIAPQVAAAYSADGLDGVSRALHTHERSLTRDLVRPVQYNSWEATEFAVEEEGQLALASLAAELGAELFVVDDGWFTGRHDDTAGLGDWHPDPAAFPNGFATFVNGVKALGLGFGLWVEPEAVSPKSLLYQEHPDWVYRVDGRPATLIRNQLLLDLGREDVFEFVRAVFDRLLTDYPIDYVKWDMNRPPTPRGRPGAVGADLDGEHVRNYWRLLDHLRSNHPHVLVEGCAGGGGRTDLATIARTDVVWPSDNTAPMDRLNIQYGFLHAHAPHVMLSWVTDHPGFFDTRPKSLRFRFVTAMAGVLGIGADIRLWTPEQRSEAASLVTLYKEIRSTIHHGSLHLIGSPADPSCAAQYDHGARTVVLAWQTGDLNGVPALPGRRSRFPLRGLDVTATYRTSDGVEYSGAHLVHAGLPITFTATHDADVVVLDRQP